MRIIFNEVRPSSYLRNRKERELIKGLDDIPSPLDCSQEAIDVHLWKYPTEISIWCPKCKTQITEEFQGQIDEICATCKGEIEIEKRIDDWKRVPDSLIEYCEQNAKWQAHQEDDDINWAVASPKRFHYYIIQKEKGSPLVLYQEPEEIVSPGRRAKY